MQSLRILDRFPPAEAYLLTLLAAHHLEMIREEQLLAYLDRGMGVAHRDARAALLESAFLRAEEIEELDHFLTRKVERGPRDFRSICRSMSTPSVDRVLRRTRNEEARRLLLESQPALAETAAAGGGNGSGALVGSLFEDESEDAPRPQTHAWIKAAVAIGLLLLVALAAVMPMDREHAPGRDGMPENAAVGALARMAPQPGDMVGYARNLYYCLPNKEAVLEQLRNDPNLTPDERQDALQIAMQIEDGAWLLNNSAWFVVRYSKGWPTGYQRALDLAKEALRLTPNDGMIVNTVGVAQYRVGQYKEALETLKKSYATNRIIGKGDHPADVGYLCMTYVKLGRIEEANEEYAAFKKLLRLKMWVDDLECIALGKEVASVMEATKVTKH
jgi:tetratricopeptide (TPR) repeat protein